MLCFEDIFRHVNIVKFIKNKQRKTFTPAFTQKALSWRQGGEKKPPDLIQHVM